MWKENQRFKNLNVNTTMKMPLGVQVRILLLSHQVTHKIQPLLRLVQLVASEVIN